MEGDLSGKIWALSYETPGIFPGCPTFMLLSNSVFVLFWLLVFESDARVYHLGRRGRRLPRAVSWHSWKEMAGLGLRQQTLVCVRFSLSTHFSKFWVGSRKDLESPPQGCLLTASILPLPSYYFLGQPESEYIMNYADCFSLLLFKVTCWTFQSGGFNNLSPWTPINLRMSALGFSHEHFSSGASAVCWALGQCFANFNVNINHPWTLLKYRFLFSRWGLKFCVSNRFIGDASC